MLDVAAGRVRLENVASVASTAPLPRLPAKDLTFPAITPNQRLDPRRLPPGSRIVSVAGWSGPIIGVRRATRTQVKAKLAFRCSITGSWSRTVTSWTQ
jgi:hypothetical protein